MRGQAHHFDLRASINLLAKQPPVSGRLYVPLAYNSAAMFDGLLGPVHLLGLVIIAVVIGLIGRVLWRLGSKS